MGNCRWTGVRLRDLLTQARLRPGAVQVVFAGLDDGPLPSVPKFVKPLDLGRAQADDVLVVHEMNGCAVADAQRLPAPASCPAGTRPTGSRRSARLPSSIAPTMASGWRRAYRIPANRTSSGVAATMLANATVPINRMNVCSFFTRPDAGRDTARASTCCHRRHRV